MACLVVISHLAPVLCSCTGKHAEQFQSYPWRRSDKHQVSRHKALQCWRCPRPLPGGFTFLHWWGHSSCSLTNPAPFAFCAPREQGSHDTKIWTAMHKPPIQYTTHIGTIIYVGMQSLHPETSPDKPIMQTSMTPDEYTTYQAPSMYA